MYAPRLPCLHVTERYSVLSDILQFISVPNVDGFRPILRGRVTETMKKVGFRPDAVVEMSMRLIVFRVCVDSSLC